LNFLEKNKRYIFAFYLVTLWAGLAIAGVAIPKELELTISGTVGLLIGSQLQKSKQL